MPTDPELCRTQVFCPLKIQCGSGLARESGGSVCIDGACAAVFAGKPAPTLGLSSPGRTRPAVRPPREQALLPQI
ncbi:hypothetical protein B1219_05200 [Pseudomonas ogarae]|nr:hypothetical protein B1219_05200 [Pseudomonas ogarae]OPG79675.1 hypothetical protein B1218_09130 [Pseudomonas ogarae]